MIRARQPIYYDGNIFWPQSLALSYQRARLLRDIEMIDHAGVYVSDFEVSKKFYKNTLSAIGYSQLQELPAAITGHTDIAGFGERERPDFWIFKGVPKQLLHIAFGVDNRGLVDAFYEAAIKSGGRDNGKPGLRERYHENYYAAFVLDIDGNNIEAVCHNPL